MAYRAEQPQSNRLRHSELEAVNVFSWTSRIVGLSAIRVLNAQEPGEVSSDVARDHADG